MASVWMERGKLQQASVMMGGWYHGQHTKLVLSEYKSEVLLCKIQCSHSSAAENECLLGCDVVLLSKQFPM
jgi:hypothetical protein